MLGQNTLVTPLITAMCGAAVNLRMSLGGDAKPVRVLAMPQRTRSNTDVIQAHRRLQHVEETLRMFELL